MAYMHRAIKVPAILRALADLAEEHPCFNPSLTAHSSFDILQGFGGSEETMALSFTGDFAASSERFRLSMAQAYKRHGGDPSVFMGDLDLEAIERAGDRFMARNAKACGFEMVVGPDDVARPAEVQS
jgi:hypothetical protein